MTELAVSGIPVTVTCRVLKLARQPYYRWLAAPITEGEIVEAHRANALFDAHHDDPEFGHRLLADEARYAGQMMADRTAWRICRDNAWWSSFGKKRGRKDKKPGPAVHDDLCTVTDERGRVRHEFAASGPNELWLTDITEHKTSEGKLYLCAVKDVFSNKIVGYSIDSRMKSSLAVNALENAVSMRGDGVVLQPAAEKRSGPPLLGHTSGAAHRDRDLDRADLPPPTPAGPTGPFDPDRIRGHHEHASRTGCVTRNCHLTVQQTRAVV